VKVAELSPVDLDVPAREHMLTRVVAVERHTVGVAALAGLARSRTGPEGVRVLAADRGSGRSSPACARGYGAKAMMAIDFTFCGGALFRLTKAQRSMTGSPEQLRRGGVSLIASRT